MLLLFLTLSIATDIYVFPQLSKESQEHFEYMIRTQSSFSESAIFCYIGVEMVVSETVNDWRFVGISVGAVLVRREDPCSCCESLRNLCLHKDMPCVLLLFLTPGRRNQQQQGHSQPHPPELQR